MTVNELIEALQKLVVDGHGETEVLYSDWNAVQTVCAEANDATNGFYVWVG